MLRTSPRVRSNLRDTLSCVAPDELAHAHESEDRTEQDPMVVTDHEAGLSAHHGTIECEVETLKNPDAALDQPGAVTDAIRTVIEAIRTAP